MKGFKLIAIKTGNEHKRFITIPNSSKKINPFKVLEKNTVYPFYSTFSFPNKDLSKILINNDSVIDLYSLDIDGKDISVNISAIVGKNGSGKSSLIELLYLATFNLGAYLKLLRDPDNNRLLKPFKELELEIFYQIENEFYSINFSEGKIYKSNYTNRKNILLKESQAILFTQADFVDYFYTITVNYSHYALNKNEVGRWVKSLFHKNDGYQTPIVLNPMRDDGTINIERENRLLKRRLQANILQDLKGKDPKKSLRNIANNKIAEKIEFVYNPNKLKGYNLEEQYDREIRSKVVSAIESTFNFKISKKDLDNNMFINISLNYICSKLLKIATYYRPYYKFYNTIDGKKSLKNINAFIRTVSVSNSHIFFKVKGAILYLKYYEMLLGDFDNINSRYNEFIIDDLAIKIQSIIDKERIFINTYMLAPPSFYDTDIILNDGTSIDSLSSGEKQKIHSISSIIYHIINLNSVNDYNSKTKNEFHSYRYLNIVLDEIELYYHPEWQRTYIHDMINAISKINFTNLAYIKGLNIQFLTHSPYILSDIPVSNVLKLDKGYPLSSLEEPQTYGSNIYDLLSDSFFLENYYIGEYARLDIEKIINTLRSTEEKLLEPKFNLEPHDLKKRINIIAEDFLRTKLLGMYYKKFEKEKNIQRELLLKQLRDLEN